MTPNMGVKTLLLTCLIILILLCYFIANTGKESTELTEEGRMLTQSLPMGMGFDFDTVAPSSDSDSSYMDSNSTLPPSNTKTNKVKFLNSEINATVQDLNSDVIKEILNSINASNEEQRVINSGKFGGAISKDTFVIVVQVHYRPLYLNFLIESLASMTAGIEDSLVIFSHDVYSEELNQVIQQQINFTRVIQIFFPSSHQLNPNGNADVKEIISTGALKVGSRPWTKAHWWWKVDFVFESLRILKGFEGFVHFLEEDDYVTPDYIHVMKKLENIIRENYCFGCNTIIAGHKFYEQDIVSMWQNISMTHDAAIITGLQDHIVNRGLGFNRTVWNDLKNCKASFNMADVDWDWAMMRINTACLKNKLVVIAPEAPRLIHTGNCGMSFNATVCDPGAMVQTIKNTIEQYKSLLFPSDIYLSLKFVHWKGLGSLGFNG